MASLSCASILCAVVLLITNGSIRHAVEIMFAVAIWVQQSSRCLPACLSLRHLLSIAVQSRCLHSGLSLCSGFVWRIFRGGFLRIAGGFSWRIAAADFRGGFAAESPVDLSKSCGDFCGGFVQVQNPIDYTSKSHRKSPQQSTAFFTACSPSM